MPNSVDNRVVAMKFDNDSFQKRIADTIASLAKLKGSMDFEGSTKNLNDWLTLPIPTRNTYSGICVRKFADKLKDVACTILGCTREQLENNDFKNTPLGEEWIRYGKADGFFYGGSMPDPIMNNVPCTKEEYEKERRINWPTAYKLEHTPRSILQLLGTQVGRFIHMDTWVNALFAEYNRINLKENTNVLDYQTGKEVMEEILPNWIISDLRLPNELVAIKKRKGLVIKVVNPRIGNKSTHESETALDDYTDWDYGIVTGKQIGRAHV